MIKKGSDEATSQTTTIPTQEDLQQLGAITMREMLKRILKDDITIEKKVEEIIEIIEIMSDCDLKVREGR